MILTVDVLPDVAAALAARRPVVALESTIIAHGMSYPANVETALALETIIKREGALPATIAVIGGRLKAGLLLRDLEKLGQGGQTVMKASIRDLGYAVSRGLDAATTVASTTAIAAMAGISVFATGGIGGVHRGAPGSFDISADLAAIARYNVAVVTAGAKAILDLPLTLEYLESLSVPVVGYGTDEFPAFYSRRSGLKCPMRLDTPEEVAHMLAAKWGMGLTGGAVIANPIPLENEILGEEIEPAIVQALAEAAVVKCSGKALTPFLLGKLAEVTGGRSLEANIALVKHNARIAAKIAVALAAT